MRINPWMVLGVAGVGFLAWKWWSTQQTQASATTIAPGTTPLQALTTGLQAGIDAGTYDANALRNQLLNLQLTAQGGTPGIV